MQISTESKDDTVILHLDGRLDAVTTADFEKAFNECFDTDAQKIIVNMAEVKYASSAGLRGILLMQRRATKQNAKIAFCSLQSSVSKVFAMAGFGNIVAVHDSQEAALAAL